MGINRIKYTNYIPKSMTIRKSKKGSRYSTYVSEVSGRERVYRRVWGYSDEVGDKFYMRLGLLCGEHGLNVGYLRKVFGGGVKEYVGKGYRVYMEWVLVSEREKGVVKGDRKRFEVVKKKIGKSANGEIVRGEFNDLAYED